MPWRELAQHDLGGYTDPSQVPRAVHYIGRALALRGPGRARNRTFDLIGLARAHLITGEPERGAALIGEAYHWPLTAQRGGWAASWVTSTARPRRGPPCLPSGTPRAAHPLITT